MSVRACVCNGDRSVNGITPRILGRTVRSKFTTRRLKMVPLFVDFKDDLDQLFATRHSGTFFPAVKPMCSTVLFPYFIRRYRLRGISPFAYDISRASPYVSLSRVHCANIVLHSPMVRDSLSRVVTVKNSRGRSRASVIFEVPINYSGRNVCNLRTYPPSYCLEYQCILISLSIARRD